MDTESKKGAFIEELIRQKGVIAPACLAVGISRQTFYDWRNTDELFKAMVKEAMEVQLDYVENKLLTKIEGGDTTAIIFYLKARGRGRGWNENQEPKREAEVDLPPLRLTESMELILDDRAVVDDGDRVVKGLTKEKAEWLIGIIWECVEATAKREGEMEAFKKSINGTAGGNCPW